MLLQILSLSVVTLVISLLLLARITNIKRHSPVLIATLTLSLFLPLSIIFLIPIDVLNTNNSNTVALTRIWKANYWTSFLLTCFILPFYQYYLASGEFNVWKRSKKSASQVALFLAFLIVLSIVCLIYFKNFDNLSSIIISLSQLSSLLFSIVCLVHGLLNTPQSILPRSYTTKLSAAYKQLPQLDYNLKDAKIDIDDTYLKIKALYNAVDHNSEFRDEILYLNAQVPESFKVPRQQLLNDYLDLSVSVFQLHENVKFYDWKYLHAKTKFNNKLIETLYYEDVLSLLSDEQELPRLWRSNYWKMPPAYYAYVVPVLECLIFATTTLLAITIIQSEVFHSTKFSLLSIVTSQSNNKSILVLLPTLLYMMATSIDSISKINVFSIYQVAFTSNSDPVSTIFFISYTIRLTIPLGYNFLTLLNPADISKSSFLNFVQGNLSHIPLATFLNSLIPRLSIVIVVLNFLGTWSKLGDWMKDTLGAFWNAWDDVEANDELAGKSIAMRWESYGVAKWTAEL